MTTQMTVADLRKRLERFNPTWPVLLQVDCASVPPSLITESTDRVCVDSGAREARFEDAPCVLIIPG